MNEDYLFDNFEKVPSLLRRQGPKQEEEYF